MSYILDALRRAQVDRERGQIPNLHAQQQPEFHAEAAEQPQAAQAAGLPLAVVGLVVSALLLLGLALWMTFSPGRPPELAPAASVAPASIATPATRSAVSSPDPAAQNPPAKGSVWPQVVSTQAAATRSPPAAQAVEAPVRVASPDQAQAQAQAQAATPAQPAAALSAPAAATVLPSPPAVVGAGAGAGAGVGVGVGAGVGAQPVPALSAEMRRNWPPLVLGGSVWSSTASARFVILNGEVLYEGGRTAGGVAVERIEPKSVVLRWQSQVAALPL